MIVKFVVSYDLSIEIEIGVRVCALYKDEYDVMYICARKHDHLVIDDGGGGLRAQMLCVMTARAALNDETNISKREDKEASEAMKGIDAEVDDREDDPC